MEDEEDKEELMNKDELMTLPTPQGTSHCSCLEHCFLLQCVVWQGRGGGRVEGRTASGWGRGVDGERWEWGREGTRPVSLGTPLRGPDLYHWVRP